MRVIPFEKHHVEEAADLFTRKFQNFRTTLPILPSSLESPLVVSGKLSSILDQNPGFVAVSDSSIVGYITGYSGLKDFKGNSLGSYTPEWGHCRNETIDGEDVYYQLHAKLTKTWKADGCHTHAVSLLPDDAVAGNYLYTNGYGMLVIDAIRGMDSLPAPNVSVEHVRAATASDLSRLNELSAALYTYLAGSPIYLYSGEKPEESTESAFIGDRVYTAVVERDGKIVGAIRGRFGKTDCCDLVQGGSVIGIDLGYVEPDFRGSGISQALLEDLLAWGRENGATACSVDFESSNFLGRKFWSKYFQHAAHSLIRHMDPRVNIE